MAEHVDPVCGMLVDPATAAGPTSFGSQTYYFCSEACLRDFQADPERYVGEGSAPRSDAEMEPERHEPPFTKKDGIVAPKFGAAASGGLEYEPLPERHDRK